MVASSQGIARIKWNDEAFKHYTERQLAAGIKAVVVMFQKTVRDRASLLNTGQTIKLKRKKRKKKGGRLISGVPPVMPRKAGSRIPIYIPGVGWRMSKKRRRRAGIANVSQITIYPNSSKPGEAVRFRTGFGHKNIVGGWQKHRGRVGYTRNARYMTWHELGIRYPRGTQQRPLIIPALRDSIRQLAREMERAARSVKP
jgi:hypothetical protein